MPIYEYECSACHCRFERKQHFHEQPLTHCPRCQAEVRRLLYPTPIIFKGSGFYTTDHRKEPESQHQEKEPTAKETAPEKK